METVELPLEVTYEPVTKLSDPRGELFRCFPFPVKGEVYSIKIHAGLSRGHHLHRLANEWFVGLEGETRAVILRPSDGLRLDLPLLGHRLRVPAGWVHAVFASPVHEGLVLAAMDRPHDPGDVIFFKLESP